jgi:cation diffusion facilitator CzcD-associated flavoprotein CzcO
LGAELNEEQAMNAEVQVKPEIHAGHRNPRVVIAGMSGLLAAIKLHEAGITDVTIFEKGATVGGTWRDNRYPGLSCDVPAHMYTYSFEPNPDYSHRYARGPEIFAYFERVAQKYNLMSNIKFNTELVRAAYTDGAWHLTTKNGEEAIADIVISASGVLHHPQYPDIEGLDTFAGPKFHTARWDQSVDLTGKRVGLLGTGSTSIQIVPQVQKVASKLTLFQRTPQWIYPLPDRVYNDKSKERLRRHRWIASWLRGFYSKLFEWTFAKAVIGNKGLLGFISWVCRYHLESKVKDPVLREKLRPNYQAACKRLIFANGFYEAIQEPNAELVTEPIVRVEPQGIRTSDGRLHELDVLVLATGFKAHNFMRPMEMIGENGVTLDQAWENGAQAYRSIAMPGFPNFFMLIGPNSPIGNYSLITISEMQMNYIMQLVELWRSGRADQIEPRSEATRRFNQAIKDSMGGTVWVSGCQSWYIDAHGNPAMWPWSFRRFAEEMAHPQLSEFEMRSVGAVPDAAKAA